MKPPDYLTITPNGTRTATSVGYDVRFDTAAFWKHRDARVMVQKMLEKRGMPVDPEMIDRVIAEVAK